MKRILEMKAKRANLIHQARQLVDRADAENRAMHSDEEASYDKFMNDVDQLGRDIEREEKLSNLESGLENSYNQPLRQNPGGQSGESANPRALKEYGEAFNRFLRGGLGNLTQAEFQNMVASNDPAGGYLVAPQQFVEEILKKVDDMVFIRQWAQVEKLLTAESLGRPTLDTDPADADWTSELATGNETDMVFGKRELRPNPLAKRIKASNKLMRVSTTPMEQLVRDRIGYKFGVTLEKAYLLGDGVNKPLGVFTASNDGISTARDVATGNTTTAPTFDGLIEAKYALKGAYWKNAKWMFHRDGVKTLAKIKNSDGDYIWKESVRVGEPDTILNLPVFMSEFVPNTFTTGKYVGILGDFSYYQIVDALDMQIQRLNELYAETN